MSSRFPEFERGTSTAPHVNDVAPAKQTNPGSKRRPRPTLKETDEWFSKEVLPKRTAWAGGSPSRIWKGPRAKAFGNTEDPNGVCGDTTTFVFEEFMRKYDGTFDTADGYYLMAILWDSTVTNHIANVMLKKDKVSDQSYRWDSEAKTIVATSRAAEYNDPELFAFRVYDLYFKKLTNVGDWWKDLDGGKGGVIRLAQYADL